MKIHFFLFMLLLQNCKPSQSSSVPASGADGDFRALISQGKDVCVENQTIDAPLDFTALLPAHTTVQGAKRAQSVGAITFTKCRFKSRVSAFKNTQNEETTVSFEKNLTFLECTFEDEVSFRGCAVQDLACFSGSIFLKKANFESADFGNDAVFSNCQFQADSRFQNVFFRKKANFLHSEFSKSVNFQGAAFALDAQFGDVKSYTSADFSTAQFNGHAFFNYAEWHGQSMFDEVWFKGRCEFLQSKFVKTTMKNVWFLGKPRFEGAKIDINLDVSGCHWVGGKIDLGGLEQEKVIGF